MIGPVSKVGLIKGDDTSVCQQGREKLIGRRQTLSHLIPLIGLRKRTKRGPSRDRETIYQSALILDKVVYMPTKTCREYSVVLLDKNRPDGLFRRPWSKSFSDVCYLQAGKGEDHRSTT